MADFHVLPVLDIQSDNIQEAWPTLKLAVKTSTFVALDTELSGLGNRRQLNAKSADERYEALSNISRTRSILSVGVSSFKLITKESSTTKGESSTNQEVWSSQTQSSSPGLKFQVQTFNILMLCSEDFVVEPLSLRFLTEHGFDFNRQYAKGIPYYRGIDKKNKDRQWLRELFAEMITNKVPTVFHNAFVDLGYLYQSFHTDMPANMMSFLADLTELFPGGIYDTKYITENTARFQASYLQYVFRKCQRVNNNRAQDGESHVQVATLNYPLECSYVSKLPCSIFRHPAGNIQQVCHLYAAHGWCSAGVACSKSHDVDLILDTEDQISSRKKNKRKRKKPKLEDASEMEAELTESREECILNTDSVIIDDRGNTELASDNANNVKARAMDVVTECGADSSTTEVSTAESRTEGHHAGSTEASTADSRTGGHRAGFDAFMTGFIFAHYISQYGTYTELSNGMCLGDFGVEQFTNKVTLTGKDIPLQIVKSTFAKTSKDHNEKMQRIMKSQ